ncbi:aminoacyl tRNA synthase complex-interacting multifunctional protein 1-like isoform X2 [Anguilla anguilla]|uniref:aminoacyl tRNA synthase complex-interacting multifunctional protein 1-like isoform X2 n=1 Tax=Anguilla anguilla TaxID=7936 RepID=UPI0015AD1199|nr:aminoacyl tRNA synthase complex-interacting multifunctional protein 1-like isoform X2 [Anguilla anguilla]
MGPASVFPLPSSLVELPRPAYTSADRFLAPSIMSGRTPPLTKMDQKTGESDQIMEYFKQQVQLLKEKAMLQASVREEKKLLVENAKLKKDIEDLKKVLQEKQKRRTARQATPTQNTPKSTAPECGTPTAQAGPASSTPSAVDKNPQKNEGRRRRAERKGERRERRLDSAALDQEPKVDVSRLDLRVGRIVTAQKHPDADSLFVEEVDVGEAAYRTVVSGLVKDTPLEQNRMVVLLCNLRPSKMRGVLSQAMVMCATSQQRVEILDPPSGAMPGDRVTFQSFPGEPDKELNPKQRVWERVQADLRTDGKCVATYQGAAFEVRGKGLCKSQTMSHCGIK